MSVQEEQTTKAKYYNEAIRFMDNAKESLQKARKDGNFYQDTKYVKTACGTAYSGILLALDGWLALKGFEPLKKRSRKSIEYYTERVGKVDRKLLDSLNGAYRILHLWGYYDGENDVRVLKTGFDDAYTIINKIKPRDAA